MESICAIKRSVPGTDCSIMYVYNVCFILIFKPLAGGIIIDWIINGILVCVTEI